MNVLGRIYMLITSGSRGVMGRYIVSRRAEGLCVVSESNI